MLDKLTSQDFETLLRQQFRLHAGTGEPLPVELIQVTRLPAGKRPPGLRQEPFSLVFRGPKNAVLPQRIYTIVHESLGRLDLFLVPIGPDGLGMRYEAVFN